MAEDTFEGPDSPAKRSYKPKIIRRLFKKRWNPNTRELSNRVVFAEEIRREHAEYRERRGQPQEVTNVYAFMKDLLRSKIETLIGPLTYLRLATPDAKLQVKDECSSSSR